MRKLMLALMCLFVMAMSVSAEFIAFEAESERFTTQVGAAWVIGEDEGSLGGEYIVLPGDNADNNTIDLTEENTSVYLLNIPAGTYTLYVKYRLRVADGADDSFYLSQNSFEEGATLVDFNAMDIEDMDGSSTTDNYGWIQVHNSWGTDIRTYVQDTDGEAYFKIHPRETGLELDAFVFVPEGESVTSGQLDEAVISSHIVPGAATNPEPTGKNPVDSETISQISWLAPVHDNIDYVEKYTVYFGTVEEPNDPVNTPIDTTDLFAGVTLEYGTTYFWRVDSHVYWLTDEAIGNLFDIIKGEVWEFTTLPDDKTPVVMVDDVLTSMEYLSADLSATVDDWGEGDIASVTWDLLPALNTSMQMLDRPGYLANLAVVTDDPNMLRDWIGSDIRDSGGNTNNLAGKPMLLTIKGLPAGSYTWKSYHHDAENQTGMFDVKIEDSDGSRFIYDIDISNGTQNPITTLETTISSNGTDDVIIYFDQQFAFDDLNYSFFLMNAFELTDQGSNSLMIDFDEIQTEIDEQTQEEITFTYTMPGYQSYQAYQEDSATFTEQSYAAFGTTVSILPTWGVQASLDYSPTTDLVQSATLDTEWDGLYRVQVIATDAAGQSSAPVVIRVRVADNGCQAAQLDTETWGDFSAYDANEDCYVDVQDLALLSAQWLDDRLLYGQK